MQDHQATSIQVSQVDIYQTSLPGLEEIIEWIASFRSKVSMSITTFFNQFQITKEIRNTRSRVWTSLNRSHQWRHWNSKSIRITCQLFNLKRTCKKCTGRNSSNTSSKTSSKARCSWLLPVATKKNKPFPYPIRTEAKGKLLSNLAGVCSSYIITRYPKVKCIFTFGLTQWHSGPNSSFDLMKTIRSG